MLATDYHFYLSLQVVRDHWNKNFKYLKSVQHASNICHHLFGQPLVNTISYKQYFIDNTVIPLSQCLGSSSNGWTTAVQIFGKVAKSLSPKCSASFPIATTAPLLCVSCPWRHTDNYHFCLFTDDITHYITCNDVITSIHTMWHWVYCILILNYIDTANVGKLQ